MNNGLAWKITGILVTVLLLFGGWLYKAVADQVADNTRAIRTVERVLPEILTELRHLNRMLEEYRESK